MKEYLFDFDGTLVDSMPYFGEVMTRILEEHGIPYGPDLIKTITPLGYGGTARYFRTLGIDRTEQELIAMMNRYALPAYQNVIPAKESVIPVLCTLRERGAQLHVLTASPHSMLDPCLRRLGIWELFTNVWSCDDFGTTKANPEIYKMAAARIGKPVEQILFLDDNLNADKTAKAAGMRVCGVFDPSSEEYEDAIRQVTDHYIYSFTELLEI